jgi:hypothetical protein
VCPDKGARSRSRQHSARLHPSRCTPSHPTAPPRAGPSVLRRTGVEACTLRLHDGTVGERTALRMSSVVCVGRCAAQDCTCAAPLTRLQVLGNKNDLPSAHSVDDLIEKMYSPTTTSAQDLATSAPGPSPSAPLARSPPQPIPNPASVTHMHMTHVHGQHIAVAGASFQSRAVPDNHAAR